MIKSFGCAVVMVAVLAFIVPTVGWSGATSARIHITVVDAETTNPIPHAEVIFLRSIDQEILSSFKPEERDAMIKQLEGYATTGQNGSCEITRMFSAGGTKNVLWRTGNFYIEGPIVFRAEGYEQEEGLIQNYLGRKKFSLSEKRQELTIYLKKKAPNKALEPTTMPVTFRANARTEPGLIAARF